MNEEKFVDENPIEPFKHGISIPEDILQDFGLVCTIDGTEIYSTHKISEEYAREYLKRTKARYLPQTKIFGLYIQFFDDDDNVNVWHFTERKKFERIRRITGYLVGTLDRFNDAKRAEESQRVKHGVGNV